LKPGLPAFVLVFLSYAFSLSLNGQEAKRSIRALSTEAILNCLSYKAQCSQDSYDLREELLRRRPIVVMIRAFEQAPKNSDGAALQDLIKELLYFVARDRGDVRIDGFMRREMGDGTGSGDYYNALYLAGKGDRKALAILNKNCWKYGISSVEWAGTLREFGRQNYRGAIPCLIESANAASLNAADAAYQSLLRFYPDAPKDMPSPGATEEYFKKRYAREKLHSTPNENN